MSITKHQPFRRTRYRSGSGRGFLYSEKANRRSGMKMSMRTLCQWVREGRGQGHGADYKPWLQMSRRRSPSNANVNFRRLSTIGRHGHFLSENEWHVALWLMWLGLEDLREQFPLWPFPHPHPLYDHPEFSKTALPASRGTLAIARDLGIRHGVFVGTQIPYIATTDFMISIRGNDGSLKAMAVAVKPHDIADGSRSEVRVNERLILEMAYASEIGIRWTLLSNAHVPEALRANLEICYPAANLSESLSRNSCLLDFCSEITKRLETGEPVGNTIEHISRALELSNTAPSALFYYGLWHRMIPIDLREPILLSQPAVLTDFTWVAEKKKQIMGDQPWRS